MQTLSSARSTGSAQCYPVRFSHGVDFESGLQISFTYMIIKGYDMTLMHVHVTTTDRIYLATLSHSRIQSFSACLLLMLSKKVKVLQYPDFRLEASISRSDLRPEG